jgi:poly-beta-hydroxyalkanoate depolymerase
MQYMAYELAHLMIQPMRLACKTLKHHAGLPLSQFAGGTIAKQVSAMCEVF